VAMIRLGTAQRTRCGLQVEPFHIPPHGHAFPGGPVVPLIHLGRDPLVTMRYCEMIRPMIVYLNRWSLYTDKAVYM